MTRFLLRFIPRMTGAVGQVTTMNHTFERVEIGNLGSILIQAIKMFKPYPPGIPEDH